MTNLTNGTDEARCGGSEFNAGLGLRGTGRTTRMIEYAILQAKNGRAVYVLAATESHANYLRRTAGEKASLLGVKFGTSESFGNVDWQNMKLKNAHPNCVLIADHYAIESKFRVMLNMLHKYDTPNV